MSRCPLMTCSRLCPTQEAWCLLWWGEFLALSTVRLSHTGYPDHHLWLKSSAHPMCMVRVLTYIGQRQGGLGGASSNENWAIATLHIILHHNYGHHQHPSKLDHSRHSWHCVAEEQKASVTFRRSRSVRSPPATASQVRPSCELIRVGIITHYRSISHPCDIISCQQTSVSASPDISRNVG